MSHGAVRAHVFSGCSMLVGPALLKRWVEMCHASPIFKDSFGSEVFPRCVRNVGGERAQERLVLQDVLVLHSIFDWVSQV